MTGRSSATTDKPDTKVDDNTTKADRREAPGLFVVAYTGPNGTSVVELLAEDQAEARVNALTYGSKQHRKEREEADLEPIEGGGTHEINRADIHVYRLSASPVTDF